MNETDVTINDITRPFSAGAERRLTVCESAKRPWQASPLLKSLEGSEGCSIRKMLPTTLGSIVRPILGSSASRSGLSLSYGNVSNLYYMWCKIYLPGSWIFADKMNDASGRKMTSTGKCCEIWCRFGAVPKSNSCCLPTILKRNLTCYTNEALVNRQFKSIRHEVSTGNGSRQAPAWLSSRKPLSHV